MEDNREFEEVSLISHTAALIQNKLSPLETDRIYCMLRHLQKWDCDPEEDKCFLQVGKKFDAAQATKGLMQFVAFQDAHKKDALSSLELTEAEIKALSEYRYWVANEPLLRQMNRLTTQLQRVAGDKVSYIAATDQQVLITNGTESRLLNVRYGKVTVWGGHFFVQGNWDSSTLHVYDHNFELRLVFERRIYRDCPLTSSEMLVLLLRGSAGVVSREDFEEQISESQRRNKQSSEPPAELTTSGVCPEEIPKPPSEAKKSPIFAASRIRVKDIRCVSICPHTGELAYVVVEERDDQSRSNKSRDHSDDSNIVSYIQRGKDITKFTCPYTSELSFTPLYESYSGNWYLLSCAGNEPQDKCLFWFDQKSLCLFGQHWFSKNNIGYEWTLQFLKPHDHVFPFLIHCTGYEILLCCEFRSSVYEICGLNETLKCNLSSVGFLSHLCGRLWLGLESPSESNLLVVDTQKLYKLLQLN